jgi:hypothetical protein
MNALVLAATAAIMVSVFLSFVHVDDRVVKEFGPGCATDEPNAAIGYASTVQEQDATHSVPDSKQESVGCLTSAIARKMIHRLPTSSDRAPLRRRGTMAEPGNAGSETSSLLRQHSHSCRPEPLLRVPPHDSQPRRLGHDGHCMVTRRSKTGRTEPDSPNRAKKTAYARGFLGLSLTARTIGSAKGIRTPGLVSGLPIPRFGNPPHRWLRKSHEARVASASIRSPMESSA